MKAEAKENLKTNLDNRNREMPSAPGAGGMESKEYAAR
jgi:hypothetical protein